MKTAIACATALLLISAATAHSQTLRTRRVMREKLAHTQRILEALTTSDLALLERESVALLRVTESPQWSEVNTPELRPYTDAFVKAIRDLAESARQRDLDAAAAEYGTLTMTCYRCHKYRKDSRVAAHR
jgi:hypothetical protein